MGLLKIAHRGASGCQPENTMLAFATAISPSMGANAIEFDVRSSKDGELVVMHDETVNRTTNGRGRVKDLTLGELRRLHAAKEEGVPTLEQVLRTFGNHFVCNSDFGNRLICNIELKERWISDKVLEIVKKCDCVDSVIVSAFSWEESKESDWNDLYALKIKEKKMKIGLLAGGSFIKKAIFVAKTSSLFPIYSLHFPVSSLTYSLVRSVKQETDCKILAWSTNDRSAIERLKKMGVSGIFSDYPDRL